jgi:hypothetical protein
VIRSLKLMKMVKNSCCIGMSHGTDAALEDGTVSYKSKNNLMSGTTLKALVGLIFLGCIAAGNAQSAEVTVEQAVSALTIKAQQPGLNLVSNSPLIARGQTVGTVVIYDDPGTARPADYLELYDTSAELVAIVWFDRFGIQRTVVDRALVEGGEDLEGVLVSVLEGEPI